MVALAAWLELTERWFAMPEDPLHNLPCVSNLNSLQIRSLGCNVHAEYALSSIPMFDHCCATCGRLLSPGISADHSAADVGIYGPACQIRGQHTTWDALPLCLLLWSKWTLSRTLLRGVAKYDENTNQQPTKHLEKRSRRPPPTATVSQEPLGRLLASIDRTPKS